MNLVAWILSAVCAATFLASGTVKSVMSKQLMIKAGQTGVASFPLPVVRIVALSELLSGAGLILTPATGSPSSSLPSRPAGWLATVMVGAAISHSRLREFTQFPFVNTPLFAALATIAGLRVALV